jgi:hypothetical protein
MLDIKNRCLLFKLINEEGLWQQLLYDKYRRNKKSQVTEKPNNSPFWNGLMGVIRV